MSANAAKLKKRAVELEQKKQLDKALAIYIQFLQESEGALDDIDVPLYNRVGDLLLRTGNASDALNYYEKAVDLYAERGFLNNAIALCNKVLRQSPGRASIYYKLGKISATKGFKSDAKKNFLEYADRMQKGGQIDEAFRALKEFADLCPDQDDIRLMLAEQLTKENRHDEALEQLHKLHDKLDSEGRMAEARATVDRMKSIDPEAVPRVSGTYRAQKSSDLIFLDTSFEQASRSRQPNAPPPPAASRSSVPSTPLTAGRQVSDPDLVILTLGDQPDGPLSPAHNAAVADAFALDIDMPNDDEPAIPALSMLDIEEDIIGSADSAADSGDATVDVSFDAGLDLLPSAEDLEEQAVIASGLTPVEDTPAIPAVPVDQSADSAFALPADADAAIDTSATVPPAAFAINAQADPAPVDLIFDRPTYVSGPPLGVDYASDLHTDAAPAPETSMDDLFDFRAPPRSENAVEDAPSVLLDPDVAFPSFDLDDASLPSADEVTSGASLAAALGVDDPLGDSLDTLDLPAGTDTTEHVFTEIVETFDAGGPQGAPPTESMVPDFIDAFTMADESTGDPSSQSSEMGIELASPGDAVADAVVADDFSVVASEVAPSERATPPASVDPVLEDLADAPPSVDVAAPPPQPTPASVGVEAREPAREPEVPEDRRAGWEIQRAHAERLLEAGDRAAGVRELEQVAVDLERIGDLERALTIIDELIRLTPETIRHHQKRVELAFRASDRARLIDAYIELGDVLFRSGEERKARAVYQRVLELAPDDPRARAAVDSVATNSPPAGSGAIAAISSPGPRPDARTPNAPARPHQRDSHVSYQSGPTTVVRGAGGIVSAPPTRKPSPLDRTAAPAGEFVDLGAWLRSGDSPKSTRMVAEEKPPTGDEQADFQEMLKRFKQGIAENVDDEDYESHYDLGVAYKEMGLMDEAVAEFQKALRGTAHRVRSYEALGQCFVEKEQYHVAASVLSRAIALGEGDDHHLVGVLYLLGRATEALNKNSDAVDYYQRVFAVDIEFRDVAERISAIEGKTT